MSAYVSPTNWAGIKATLLGDENNPGIDNDYAELIIALLQMAENRNPDISPRILELADELKLLSIQDLRRLNAELLAIAQNIGVPSIYISNTEQNVKWWRTFTTYLFGAGVAIAVINIFVPIQFGLIAQTVFATGLDAARVFFSAFSGTSAPATEAVAAAATAAAAGTGPSMVAGPDLGAIGVTIYALSIVALTKCAGIVVSVVSGACSLMTIPNAEKVADLAVQAVTIAGLTVGLDKGSDFIVRFYRGDFDAAIAAMIDQGIFDAAQNAAINTLLEAIKDIDDNKIGIRWNQGSAYSRDFKPSDRQLDVNIMDIIQGTFDESLNKLGETSRLGSRLGSRAEIMNVLHELDGEPPDPNAIIRLKEKYGMQILILYMLLSQKAKKAKSGYGWNPNVGSSQPTETAEKWVETSDRSASNPASVGRPGTNPYMVDYNLKTQILRDTGYSTEESFKYYSEFQGSMSECMKQVLGCLFDKDVPHMGNIFTAISQRGLLLPKQKEIFDYMSKECKKMTGDQDVDNAKINAIAIVVRTMFPQPSAGPAAAGPLMVPAAAGPFANIKKTEPAFPVIPPYARKATATTSVAPDKASGATGQATGKASAASSSATSATGKASATGFTGKASATGFTGKASNKKIEVIPKVVSSIFSEAPSTPNPNPNPNKSSNKSSKFIKGGRKSRRYKKRKATLKRRRIRRRSTRKGRKRRYTKRR